jgi:hypothetical protein
MYDKYGVNVNDYSRIDNSVGAFEYMDNFSVVLGGRIDNHNRLGIFCYAKITCAIQSLGERSFAIFSRETKRMFFKKKALAVQEPLIFRYQSKIYV